MLMVGLAFGKTPNVPNQKKGHRIAPMAQGAKAKKVRLEDKLQRELDHSRRTESEYTRP
jgi:hypothetical protein